MNSCEEKEIRRKLKYDFEHYALKCLFIRNKLGVVEPFTMNKAQKYVHGRLENQKQQTGMVRALILKGRQQGMSTYVGGRFYHRTTHSFGLRTFILTHEQSATDNLFAMTKRYHDNCPPLMQPSTSASSSKELVFGGLDSDYKIGTAGSRGVGRSSTIQLFHGSEVAFWPNADTHAVGVMQAISDSEGTEIILESTANGLGNYFHEQWKKAEAGLSDYQAIFVPWFWQNEYRKELKEGFTLTDEEEELKRQYKIDDDQLYWRRNKIVELSTGGVTGEDQFKQEYPMNAAEAFRMSGVETLIKPSVVMRARKNKVSGVGPKILGVDPSHGGDRFVIMYRQGRKMKHLGSFVGNQVDTLQKRVAKVMNEIENIEPDMVFVDAGFGADIVDYIRGDLKFNKIKAISFGGSPLREDRYINKRAEMYGEMAEWFKSEIDVQCPDTDTFQADVCACPYDVDAHRRIKILEKKQIKKDLGFSPDEGDAAALTWAEDVFTDLSRSQGWTQPTRAKKRVRF